MIHFKSEPAGAAAAGLGTEVWTVKPSTALSGHMGSACSCRALSSMLRSTEKNEFTRIYSGQSQLVGIITVLSDGCQEGRRDSCPGPWESEAHQPAQWGGLMESRWAVLELSFERREREEEDGEEGLLGWKQPPDEDEEAWRSNGIIMRPWWCSLSRSSS